MEENYPYANLLLVCLLTFIAINLFILDLKVFSPQANSRLSDVSTSVSLFPTKIATPVSIENQSASSCPQTCLSLIKEATTGGIAIGGPLTIQPTTIPAAIIYQSSAPREYYIPLGTGTTQKNTWDDLTGTETVIDPANYGKISEVYFIASLKNPTQNGQTEAQLYNVTDKHPVWGSSVIMNGPASQTITSSKISLDAGNKLYRVQLKSSMQYPVSLDSAKIRIVTE